MNVFSSWCVMSVATSTLLADARWVAILAGNRERRGEGEKGGGRGDGRGEVEGRGKKSRRACPAPAEHALLRPIPDLRRRRGSSSQPSSPLPSDIIGRSPTRSHPDGYLIPSVRSVCGREPPARAARADLLRLQPAYARGGGRRRPGLPRAVVQIPVRRHRPHQTKRNHQTLQAAGECSAVVEKPSDWTTVCC